MFEGLPANLSRVWHQNLFSSARLPLSVSLQVYAYEYYPSEWPLIWNILLLAGV